jgi:hypothetical protein
MSIILNEMRFLGVNSSLVNLIEKKDSTNNEKTEYYSLDDIRGYKVYTALLTQSGGGDSQSISNDPLTIGATYEITQIDDGDFTNVGAPNNNLGTYFVATGTTPNWGTFGENVLEYNTGAPVVTVLENTIGNIWFTYSGPGAYEIILSNSIDIDKTFLHVGNGSTVGGTLFYEESGFKTISFPSISGFSSTLFLYSSGNGFGVDFIDNRFNKTPIEIRVYN